MAELQSIKDMTGTPREIAERVFRAKAAAHQAAARRPIEEKLRALVEMQRRANAIRRAVGRPEMLVWPMD